ncbi:MAG: histidine phosphatase family protein [Winogradskyella sp.]|uniref:SixA phosphatase family protein n=1 Tax=Winogradskyella sp. TaxID=1883156 RepID=UPI0018067C34|nr:histidine phosphatase family protein [Winogradskyella sp.]MBT8246014.1 histidine phosphatase family protein [Winogradskyella sp.]NNK21944.1 histidine phosphatase family protein [Winogradskyella sp.]
MKEKRVILIRHAKSSWEYGIGDIDRPLKKRGIKDASTIAKVFKEKNYVLDRIYSSPANRAFSTCNIFKRNLNWTDNEIEIVNELYDFGGESVLNFIATLNNTLDTVVIFGHNHAFTAIANMLGDKFIDNLPTSGLVVLKFNIDSWEFARYGETELLMFPRDYRA